jgi:hypothetical protein
LRVYVTKLLILISDCSDDRTCFLRDVQSLDAIDRRQQSKDGILPLVVDARGVFSHSRDHKATRFACSDAFLASLAANYSPIVCIEEKSIRKGERIFAGANEQVQVVEVESR